MSDPWVILKQLAGDGIESVSVEVRCDDGMIRLTDAALERALEDGKPGNGVSVNQLRAARTFVGMSETDIRIIEGRAKMGDPMSQRAKQALILLELVKLRPGARFTAQKALEGDPEATEYIARIEKGATMPGREQEQYRIAAFMLRDAFKWLDRQAMKAEQAKGAESEKASKTPAKASAKDDDVPLKTIDGQEYDPT